MRIDARDERRYYEEMKSKTSGMESFGSNEMGPEYGEVVDQLKEMMK